MLSPGQLFASRYRIIGRLGEGGMGAVFEGEHTGTERRVAIKVLWPHVMSVESAREKFELEAKVAARVNNEHVVQVLDAGLDEQTKAPFLVMELLRGSTLADLVARRGPLPPEEAIELLRQTAKGLDAAHGYVNPEGNRTPIVHRDLKPENLFVTQGDNHQSLKILDFGIAKVISETQNVSQEIRGTPVYMAPEQLTGDPLSAQTDIWALGLIAYFTLTGERFWSSAAKAGAPLQSLFAEILTLPIKAPSVRLREQALDTHLLPPDFDKWLLKCLDRQAARRFSSASEAINELAGVFARARPAKEVSSATIAEDQVLARTATFYGDVTREGESAAGGSVPALASEPGAITSEGPRWGSKIAAAVLGATLLMLGVLVWVLLPDGSPPESGAKLGVSGEGGQASPGASQSASAVHDKPPIVVDTPLVVEHPWAGFAGAPAAASTLTKPAGGAGTKPRPPSTSATTSSKRRGSAPAPPVQTPTSKPNPYNTF